MMDSEKSQERMELEALYAETFKNLQEGSVVEGIILSVQEDGVMVDIGYKSEGMVPKQEFTAEEIGKLKPGEKIQIYLEEREDSEGNIILSNNRARAVLIALSLFGVDEKRLRSEGRGPDEPVVPELDDRGKKVKNIRWAMEKNRRIDVVVDMEKMETPGVPAPSGDKAPPPAAPPPAADAKPKPAEGKVK